MTDAHDDRPTILVVDDKPDDLLRSRLKLALASDARVTVRHPSQIELSDVRKAHLVLMDYRLDEWEDRDDQSVAFDVRTGMALAAILREVADEETPERLTAIALHTGHLGDASGRLRRPHSRHVVARLNNLEWVFEKSDDGSDAALYRPVVQLAHAVQRLQGDWPVDSSTSEARTRRLLKPDDDAGWSERAWREVRECQPPVYELGGGPHGVFFLRWLLHQILPYPCFLWSVDWVAARLRISVDDLERLLASDCALAQDLERLKYTGLLAGFLGDRWWRTAIEDYAWKLRGESAGRPTEFEDRIREKAGEDLELVEPRDPVVCLDRDFQPWGVASPQDAVRVRPDYWPPFADAAWMTIEAVSADSELRAMVEPLDQYRVELDG